VREHNERNGFAFPFEPNLRALTDMSRHPRWLLGVLLRSTLRDGPPRNALWPEQYQRMVAWRRDAPKPARFAAMTWHDIARIREVWPRTLIVKSVLTPLDARLAVDHGADGIIVSNHGGRSMDSAVAAIDALPEIVKAVGDRTTVILDSGIRRGSDVVKALALGADMAMVGRATLYGAAAGGQAGVERALGILASEFEKTMGYVGCRRISEIGPDIIARAPRYDLAWEPEPMG
jgi:isopentenyl diphosphate isomerase/L-lactate dehydrogenase-like FMN-dependent dehydrogenase